MSALARTTDWDSYSDAANDADFNSGPKNRTKYAYDLAGQRTATTGTWASDQLPAATASDYQSDAANRLTSGNGYTVSYDANGAPLSDGRGNSYTWDARRRLVAITQGPATVATFAYDAFGRRTAKTIGSSAATSYLYDGGNVAQEVQGSTTRNLLNGLSIDERYARDDVGGRTYFSTDALGSTIALTDTTGAIVQQYVYEPYGQVVLSNPSSALTNPYQYTGRENDGTGLYYYRARYYDPLSKRFISEDPIGLAGGPNGYAYTGDNPLGSVDPSGLLAIYIGGLGSIAGGPLAASSGGGIVFDFSGNIGTYTVTGVGGGQGGDASFGLSIGFVAASSINAPSTTIDSLAGPFASASSAIGLGPHASIDAFSDPDNPVIGGGMTFGVGAGARFSIQATNTVVTPITFDSLLLSLGGLHKGPNPCH